MNINARIRRFETPTDYIGKLETTGKGVGVAVFDSGIFPHPDVTDSLAASVTVRKEGRQDNDWMGHGTAVAGVIAGNGGSAMGKLAGVAPGAKLMNVQILPPPGDKEPPMHEVYAGVLNGIEWVLQNKERHNIRVINISAGLLLVPSFDKEGQFQYYLDPLRKSIQSAIDAGISVIAAAGNDGNGTHTIDRTPGIAPNVITVGALDTNGTPADTSDDSVAKFSSRGPTPEGVGKPDILAPGVGILCANVPHAQMAKRNDQRQAIVKGLEVAPAPLVLTAIADRVKKGDLYSGVFKEAIPSLREAMMKNVKPKLAEALKDKHDMVILGFAAKLMEKGALTEEQLKEPLAKLREVALDNLQPRPTKYFLQDGNFAYMSLDGTSFAAPIVSGVVAHMYEVNPKLTPADVQSILKETANPLPGVAPNDGGAGALNAQAAIAEARRRAS